MGVFDGVLFCTDLDGTVLRDDKTISKRTLEAIDMFKREGGIFTFITGRMPFFAGEFYRMLKPNGPFGCVNGGGLYDYEKGDYIWSCTTDDVMGIEKLILLVEENLPGVATQINTLYGMYYHNCEPFTDKMGNTTAKSVKISSCESVKEPIAKIIFRSDVDEEVLRGLELLQNHPLAEKYDFVRSEKVFFEILPKGVSKGTALCELASRLGISLNKTVAIGDYNNDISMIKAAKLGIAVANASEDTLRAADYVTVSNQEDAVAQVIEELKAGKLSL